MPATSRRRFPQAAALLLFFCSGAAGLIYEVSWSRQFGDVFGHSIHTSSSVLFSFLGGMAVGYWLAGRIGRRRRPLLDYGILEIGIGAWAILVPLLLHSNSITQLNATNTDPLRAVACFLLLLPATVCLGATWPLMAAFLSPPNDRAPRLLSWAYAVNTAGSLVGSLSATVILLAEVGVRKSSYLSAAISIACGIGAILLSRWCGEETSDDNASPLTDDAPTPYGYAAWRTLVAVSGFAVMALEVLYFRLFSLVFHNSTYTFGAVVTVFLLALAGGSALVGTIGSRVKPATLAAMACGIGAIGIGWSLGLFVWITDFRYFQSGATFASYHLGALAFVTAIVLPPVAALGMILPTAWRAFPTSSGAMQVADFTAVGTFAGACGAVATSFALLPMFGLWGTFALLIALYFALACVMLLRAHRLLSIGLLVIVALLTAEADWRVMRHATSLLPGDKLIERREGPYGWIDVVKSSNGALAIRQNLHYAFGSSIHSVRRDYRQGHLPLILHGGAKNVAFLGLGTGQTAAAALNHPDVESIVVVELIRDAVEAARLLKETNRGLLDDPRVSVQVDDARRYLPTAGRKFDVITSDLFVPWETQTGYLYTVEHFRSVKQSLAPNGLFCQWLALYQLGPSEFEMIADSFASVFPEATLWWIQIDANAAVVGLIGSERPLDLRRAAEYRRLAESRGAMYTDDRNLTTDERLLTLLMGKWTVRHPDQLNTDEHPRVEFSAPISHGDRKKLSGPMLLSYFDDVLAKLPEAELLGTDVGGKAADRAWRVERQRKILFP